MGKPAAKQGDHVLALDKHDVIGPGSPPPVIPQVPHPFDGLIDNQLSQNVLIEGKPAATVDSMATNTPPHIAQGVKFVKEPSNKATIAQGSVTVLINGKGAARTGDPARTCNDPVDQPVGKVQAVGTVLIGD